MTIMPYEERLPAVQHEQSAVARIEESRAVSEMQARMMLARRFPRQWHKVRDAVEQECRREKLASRAEYSYPRGKETVSGATIRLLEMIARNMGNVNYGFEVLSSTRENSEVRAFAVDYETGTSREAHFVVRHWRDTKSGGYALKDERDIYELVANMAMRRVRACLQSIVPVDVLEEAQETCNQTLAATMPPDKGKVIKGLLEAFAAYNVTKEHLEKRLGHHLNPDKFSPAEYVGLKKIYASIKDGYATAEDFFDMAEPAPIAPAAPENIKKPEPPAQAKAPASAPGPETPPPLTPPIPGFTMMHPDLMAQVGAVGLPEYVQSYYGHYMALGAEAQAEVRRAWEFIMDGKAPFPVYIACPESDAWIAKAACSGCLKMECPMNPAKPKAGKEKK